jgi:hypothetical protein
MDIEKKFGLTDGCDCSQVRGHRVYRMCRSSIVEMTLYRFSFQKYNTHVYLFKSGLSMYSVPNCAMQDGVFPNMRQKAA